MPADERSFFEQATEKEMIDYMKQMTMVYRGTERWLINNASIDVLKELFHQQPLAEENEVLLIKTRSAQIIQEYISRYPLKEQSEELLRNLQKDEAIHLYEKLYGKMKEG